MSSARTRELPAGITADPRRAALHAVLESTTFARSEQLRNFLRYVCELEIEGRSSEIGEYAIGVHALGRPKGFSPLEDSTVRTRAHLLRQKLAEVYERELKDADLRIELPKGNYVPRFVRVERKAPEVPERPSLVARYPRTVVTVAVAAGLIVGIAGVLIAGWISGVAPRRLDGMVRAAWGPLVEPGADVLVCVSGPVHLTMRALKSEPPAWLNPLTGPPELRDRVFGLQKRWQEAQVFLEPTEHSTRLGEAFALARASRVLEAAAAQPQIMTTSMISSAAFSGRNLILVGSPDFDGAARKLLERAAFTVGWDPGARDVAILCAAPSGPPSRSFHPVRDGKYQVILSYGLVSVIPSEGSAGGRQRAVVISGLTSAGAHGAMEYFASPYHLSELRRKFVAEGASGFPPAYQVVVRCVSSSDRLVSYHYAAHRALDAASLER